MVGPRLWWWQARDILPLAESLSVVPALAGRVLGEGVTDRPEALERDAEALALGRQIQAWAKERGRAGKIDFSAHTDATCTVRALTLLKLVEVPVTVMLGKA